MANNKLFDRVKMTVSGAPGTGTVTLGAAVPSYRTFADAGVADTNIVTYLLEDGTSWEVGTGTYTATGTTLARTTVIASSAGGTTKITATAAATVAITASTNDLVQKDSSGVIVNPQLSSLREVKTAPTISTNTLTIDCSQGNVFAVSLNQNITTLTFTNVPASPIAYSFILAFTIGAGTSITWPASVKWANAVPPVLSPDTGTDIFTFVTWTGGSTWYAFVAGQNLL